jgi:hypothetical protein
LSADLRFYSGPRLALEARWLLGTLPNGGGSNAVEWREVGLRPSLATALGPETTLDLGLAGAVASVHHTGAVVVDGETTRHTWSARGGAVAAIEHGIGASAAVRLGLEAGAVLRSWNVASAKVADESVGGLWLGLTVGVALDPLRGLTPPPPVNRP